MKSVIFDMHGIIFSFSQNNDVNESANLLDNKIKDYSKKYPKFKDAMKNDSIYLEAELKIVKEIIFSTSEIKIYEMPNAMNRLLELYEEGYDIVIISTSKIETTKMILEYLLLQKKDYRGSAQILYSFDINNSLDFGLKSQKEMWKKILEKYENIDIIYEDKEKYLDAALKACSDLGFKSKGFNTI